MVNSSKKFVLASLFKLKFNIVYALAFLVLNSLDAKSQNIISVSFKDGAIGVKGTNPQQLNNLQSFQSLQVSKAYFIQNSSSNQFFAQGNDIPGTLRLVSTSNNFLDVAGAVVWREGNNGNFIGFIPNPTNIFSVNLNTFGGANYTINQNSNFAIVFNNKSFTFTNNGSLSGDAATKQVLDDLNAYLTFFKTSRPSGPVTVTSQTTTSTTPTITGTATLANDETLSIEFNGVVYTTGITISGSNWSWTVPNSANLTTGTYSVVATITDQAGYTLSDVTSNELTISAAGVPTIGVSLTQLSPFSTCTGSASTEQTFTISGSSLTANVVISAPTGFEVSLSSGTGYAPSVTATIASGTLNSTAVYVRMTTSATGTPSGNVTVVSGSTSENVAVTGAVSAVPNLQFKLSAPNVSTSAIQGQVGTKTENFNSFTDGNVPASGSYAIGTFTKTGTASYVTNTTYGAPLNDNTLSRYLGLSQNAVVNVTLTDPSRYLGFWWAGGDGGNRVTIYGSCGGNEVQLAQFTTSTVTSLLAGATLTAVDGNVYNSSSYKRSSAGNEPFAYINLELDDPNIYFTRLEFTQTTGGGFEVDNITTGTGYGAASFTVPSAPTITSISTSVGSATINFTAPTSDGGTPITNYKYTTDGGTTWTAFSPATTSSPVTITGLVNGTNYPFQLRALNVIGPGPASNILSKSIDSGLDSDGDSITDINDPDDDNDGIPDTDELDCSSSTAVSESLTPAKFYFVEWKSFANGILSGVINVPGNPVNVTVTNSSNSILLQNDNPYGGTSNWAPLPTGNPSLSTFRSLTLGEHKFVFDQAVNNPRFFINSLNKTLDLSMTGKILKSNGNFTGNPVGTSTQVLVGNEGTGTISFSGNVTEISFTGRESEFYCNFSLGISDVADFSTCADKDTDGDGISDRLDLDSDGDGVTDAQELADGTSPTDLCSFVLENQTLTPTAIWESTDCDGDGFDNKTEVDRGSDPLVANAAPTNISLSPSSVNENVAANTTVGALITSDLDAGNTFTYTLVSGTGSTDNGAFNISGTNLRISSIPDFETKSSYSIRVRSTDQGGLFFEKSFTVTVNDLNEAPINIALSANSLNENLVANTSLGTLSSTDPDANNTFTYTLVSGAGSTDNLAFNINGSNLRITASPDFETKSSYTVRVRTTDQGGLYFEKVFTITVNDLNEVLTDMALSENNVSENVAANTTIGALSSTDEDAGSTFTYTLVSGTGSTDNAAFNISGTNLRISSSPDFETKSSYSIRVRSTDQGGLFFEKSFTITVNDLNEVPLDIALSTNTVNENVAANTIIGALSSTDEDANNTFTYTLVSGTGSTDNLAFNISGGNLRITASPDFEAKSSYTVRVRTTDQGGLFFEKVFTITVNDLNEAPTEIALSIAQIYEKNAVGALIGNLSSTDQDKGDSHTYSLVSGDVAAFRIIGNQLLANVVYTHSTKNSYDIVVKSTDAGGLSVNKAIRITILQSPILLGSANLPRNNQSSAVGNNVTISKGYSANLNLSGSNIVKYAWSPSIGLSATNISNPIANPTQTTTYTVRVTNAQGVSTDLFITVTVLEDYNITPNNVLSPDGDGVNDLWTIENLSAYPNNEVKIFDKAGRIIFNVRNYQNDWNGHLNGEKLHEGAYYYIINLGPNTRPKLGYITLFSNK